MASLGQVAGDEEQWLLSAMIMSSVSVIRMVGDDFWVDSAIVKRVDLDEC
jgi:hypothetical protein